MKASLAMSISPDGDFRSAEVLLASGSPDRSSDYLILHQVELVAVFAGIQKLRPMEQVVIIRRYGLIDRETWTLDRIGAYLSRSKERVRQIEQQALDKLRQATIVVIKRGVNGRKHQERP